MKYYLTTPIYYVNAAPHIGHTYTTIAADVIRRFKRMQGYDAVLTTGTDEHGQKIERAARAAGLAPRAFTDVVANEFREQWQRLGFGIDRFMRTSDPRHHKVVHQLFERCKERGYVYKGTYTGQYCVFCELYINDTTPGAPCPDCGRPSERVTEENYFFKLSEFTQPLLKFHEENPDFVQPEIRRNEVLAFLRQGLNDLSISRTTIRWGIPIPGEERHVFYVWFDALTTYMSAVEGEDRWPADLHLIGKEILRFHAIYWPAFLMAAELPLPKKIFAHGWLLFEQDKMSKSRGNIVRPDPIRRVMGTDAMRYFLLREIVFGQDGNFSYDALVSRYNADLANGLGNLASRTLTMIWQYHQGTVPERVPPDWSGLGARAAETIQSACQAYENLEFSKGLEAIWGLLSAADKFIVEQAPWTLARKDDAESRRQLAGALYSAAETLRIATVLAAPALPESCERIWRQLGMAGAIEGASLSGLAWGQLEPGQRIGEVTALFPRLEPKQAIESMRRLEGEETTRQTALLGKKPEPTPEPETAGRIAIDDFAKVDMRVGQVLSAQPVKGADKLLHMQVDIGEEKPRSIVAGIAQAYRAESLIGRKVVIVANLQPRKLRGIPSDGMIVAASLEGGDPVLAGFLEDVPVGARLK